MSSTEVKNIAYNLEGAIASAELCIRREIRPSDDALVLASAIFCVAHLLSDIRDQLTRIADAP